MLGAGLDRPRTLDSVYRSVLRGLHGGGTILLHDSDHAAAPDSWKATHGALPAILTTCRAHGLTVGPLADHIRANTGRRTS